MNVSGTVQLWTVYQMNGQCMLRGGFLSCVTVGQIAGSENKTWGMVSYLELVRNGSQSETIGSEDIYEDFACLG